MFSIYSYYGKKISNNMKKQNKLRFKKERLLFLRRGNLRKLKNESKRLLNAGFIFTNENNNVSDKFKIRDNVKEKPHSPSLRQLELTFYKKVFKNI